VARERDGEIGLRLAHLTVENGVESGLVRTETRNGERFVIVLIAT
jgi:hypothetical protein